MGAGVSYILTDLNSVLSDVLRVFTKGLQMTNDELFDGSNAHLMTHVVPVDDLCEHITDRECWCNPSVDDDLVVIHNSMDERESYEEGRKPQ